MSVPTGSTTTGPGAPASTASAVSPRSAARGRLLTVAAVGGSGVLVSAVYAVTGLGIPCPFKLATGIDCPLCGGTRMGAALLHLDLGAALVYNPLALVGLVVVAVLTAGWSVELIRDRSVRVLAQVGGRLGRVPSRAWWIAGIAVAVGYTAVRTAVWPIPA